jgi:hypothetical protein
MLTDFLPKTRQLKALRDVRIRRFTRLHPRIQCPCVVSHWFGALLSVPENPDSIEFNIEGVIHAIIFAVETKSKSQKDS